MSLRVSPTPLIAGAVVVGNTGLGVLGSAVPSGGNAGASYIYNDLTLPADNNVEVRGLIVTPPSAGALFAYEDGAFTLTGTADGSYSFVYRLFADGVDLGTATASIAVGIPMAASPVAVATASGALSTAITLSIATAAKATTTAALSSVAQTLSVAATAQASVSAALTTAINLAATASATATVSASFPSANTTLIQDLQALLLPLSTGGAWYGANTREPPIYPYIAWVRVSSSPNVSLQGPSLLQNTRIQIDIFSLSATESQAIEVSLEAAFASSSISNVPLSSGDQYEEMVRAYRITKEYSVWATN